MPIREVRDGQLFKDVRYFINDSIGREQRDNLESLLVDNGAAAALPPPPLKGDWNAETDKPYHLSRFDFDECTHVITDSINYPEAPLVAQWNAEQTEASRKIANCTPAWVTRSATVGLQDPLHYSPDPAMIFSGVFLQCSADLPKGDREALYGLVTALGGQQREAITKDTTHVACLSKHETTYNLIQESGLGIKFILPHWFDACIQMQQKVDDEPFLFTDTLPTMLQPETWGSDVLYEKHAATRLKKTIVGVSIPDQDKAALFRTSVKNELEDDDQEGVERLLVFQDKKVLLAGQLGLSKTLKSSLETWVRLAGGQVVENDKDLLSCDIFITPFRDGVPYLLGVKHNKLMGTLHWFYHVLKVGKLTSPKDQLLHYPIPSTPVPGFQDCEISVTNYTGEAREYLKRLITSMGAKFTTTLSADNTHLVAASKFGDKVARCRQWHIPCINHKWLEASFREWRAADVSRPEFVSFPPGINFMTLLGETGLTDDLLKKWTSKAATIGDVDLDVMLTQGEAAELGDVEEDVLNSGRDSRDDVGEGPSKPSSKPAPAKSRALRKTKIIPERPETPLGNEPPATVAVGSSSKRSAATVAAQRLHENGADMIAWEKEKKRKDGSKRGRTDDVEDVGFVKSRSRSPAKGKMRDPTAAAEPTAKRSKKKATPVKDEEDDDDAGVGRGKSLSLLGDAKVRVLATGVTLDAKQRSASTIAQVTMTDSPNDCTHLVTESIKRTEKFLIAMANSPLIVTPAWLAASATAGHLLDETPYFVQDSATESALSFKLVDALKRAKDVGKRGLFAGHTFYRTPNVETDLAMLKKIVAAHGGEVVKYTNPRVLEGSPETKHVISAIQDKALWPPLKKLGIPIYSRELILVSILKMKLELDSHQL